MVNIQFPTAEIRRGKKRRRRKKKKQDENMLWSALLHRATITNEFAAEATQTSHV